MKNYKYIIAILLNLIALTLHARTWVSIDSAALTIKKSPQIGIIVSNAEQYKFNMRIYGYEKDTIYESGTLYEQVKIADWQSSYNNVGEPSLPVFTQFIGLPANKECTVTISNAEWVTVPIEKIYPSQELREESDTTEFQFIINDSIYNCNEYITELYNISEKACVGGMYGVTLSVVPIKYYPNRNEMEILKSCVVTVNFSQSTEIIDNISIKNKKLIKCIVDNYNEELIDSYNVYIDNSTNGDSITNIYDYLIITTDKYKDTDELKTFCKWKKIKGHNCKVVPCSEIGSTRPDSIKACIKEWYKKGVEYVLFVGNKKDISYKLWEYKSRYRDRTKSDYWYSCLDDDFYADLIIGRFCVNDTLELRNIVSKTINYENLTPKDTWVTKNLLVAHQQNAPEKYQACCEEIRTATYNNMPNFTTAYGAHDSVGGDNATNDMVVSYINDGFGIVNYRGHGSRQGWSYGWSSIKKSYFDIRQTSKLHNKQALIMFNIACLTGEFSYLNSILRTMTTATIYGAVACLGATEETSTLANDEFNKYMYQFLYNDGIYEFGRINMYSHIYNIIKSQNDTCAISNAMAYICGGDPSLEIWTDTISKFSNFDIAYEDGFININSQTIEDYTITLFSQTDSSYFKKITVEGKNATISNVPSSFILSINKHNYMPLVYNISNGDIYMQNENYALTREIIGNNVYIGNNVTETQPFGNITIKSGAELNINAKGQTIINKGVMIEKGAKTYIK